MRVTRGEWDWPARQQGLHTCHRRPPRCLRRGCARTRRCVAHGQRRNRSSILSTISLRTQLITWSSRKHWPPPPPPLPTKLVPLRLDARCHRAMFPAISHQPKALKPWPWPPPMFPPPAHHLRARCTTYRRVWCRRAICQRAFFARGLCLSRRSQATSQCLSSSCIEHGRPTPSECDS